MEITKYLNRGVFQQKIVQTNSPSVCNWSMTRKCLVGENGIDSFEIIDNEMTFKNNRIITLQIRENLSDELVKEINDSDGIVITDALYDNPERFRFGFIVNK